MLVILSYLGVYVSYPELFGVLGAFATLRKATVSFVMSVCLSVLVEQLGSHWTHFHKILVLNTS
jgi:hypothetical protein